MLLERKGEEMRELTSEQERINKQKDEEIDKLEEKIHEVSIIKNQKYISKFQHIGFFA